MSWFQNLFRKSKDSQSSLSLAILKVDMHSHLLPGIDDGSQSIEESITLIRGLYELGYRKLITTPHVMADQYRNTPEIIQTKLAEVQAKLADLQISIQIEASAEYMIDDGFEAKLENKELITFGNQHILVETSMMVQPPFFEEIIFKLKTSGYRPILAHPERYNFYWQDFKQFHRLKDLGLLLQLNINSLSGVYAPLAVKAAKYLIQNNLIDFLGTDTHHERHLQLISKTVLHPDIQQLLNSGRLQNYTLCN
ncbi:MAG: hypothetical protein LC115_11585 [Bacteroidia bacterium]|nr:hypothetical protein [Bacteroidia bacterium]